MTIESDNAAEREARLDRMIDEFRQAQARRFGNRAVDPTVQPKPDATAPATPRAGTATSSETPVAVTACPSPAGR